MNTLGERLKHIRKLRKMSQSELAEKIGVTFQQIQKYEKNINNINSDKLKKLAEVLNVPVGYFFGEVDLEDVEYIKKYSKIKPPFKEKINKQIEFYHKLSYQEYPENLFEKFKTIQAEADADHSKYPPFSAKRAFYFLKRLHELEFNNRKVAESAKPIENILTNTNILDNYITRQITDEELLSIIYEQLTHYF